MSHQPIYEFGSYRLDVAERLLLRDGEPVLLQPKVFDLLLVLVEHHGHLVGKDELMKLVWPDTIVEEANLTNNISILRKTLGENGERFIETVPKRGYRFIAPVQSQEAVAVTMIESASAPSVTGASAATPIKRWNRQRKWTIAVLSFLLLGLVSALSFWSKKSSPTVPTIAVNQLAVLPFKSLHSDNGDEHLGVGIADTLITKLGGLRQLIVRPTSAVLRYGHREQDPLTAGREQQVDAVLDANWQRNGERIRVNVRLLKVSDGATLWSYQCDERYCADLFVMQDTISEKVAAALTPELTGEERQRLRKHYTENRAAYDLYTKGRYLAEKRTGESLQEAEKCYRQALALDPNYALVYVGLADIYFYNLGTASTLSERERLSRAKAAAEQALALDASLSEAHTARARMIWKLDLNWREAGRELERAIELDPNSAFAHRIQGDYLSSLGRHEEAIAEFRQALRLDPLSLPINFVFGAKLYFAGKNDEALAQLRESQKLDPNFVENHQVIGMVYAQQGKYAEAIAELEKALPLSAMNAPVTKFLIGYNYALWGKRAEALRILEEVQEPARQERILPHEMAAFYAALGDKARAFALLQQSCQEPNRYTVYLKVDPKLKLLHSDPRFADLLRCVGLPQ